MSFVYLGYFDESASPVLLDVQVEPFRLDLQHFRGQLLLARLARTCFGFENRQKNTQINQQRIVTRLAQNAKTSGGG